MDSLDTLWQYLQIIPPWLIILLVVHGAIMGTVAYLILLERKTASWVQDRIGPNRVGLGFGIIPVLKDFHFWGLGQPLADGLKFIMKEDYRPKGVDKVLFTLAPMSMVIVVIVSIAVIPWGGEKINQEMIVMPAHATVTQLHQAAVNSIPWWGTILAKPTQTNAAYLSNGDKAYTFTWGWMFQIAQLNIGVLFVLAALSLAVYGVVLGGWASNNKYSFLGGLRATANMISYEIPLGLAVLIIVTMFGTLDLGVIVDKQVHYWWGFIPAWNCFCQPAAFMMFLVCIHAEANRAPFDLAEAEQELVGGYHTEYSAMRFALFFLGEYAGMITTSAVCVALFFGGWHIPWLDLIWPQLSQVGGHLGYSDSLLICILRSLVFFGKTIFILFVFMWVRWSLPRYRFDQLMMLAWRALIPMSLILLIATTLVLYFFAGDDALYAQQLISEQMFLILLGMNIVAVILIMLGSLIVPAAPPTNRKMHIRDSRFQHTLVPAGTVVSI